MRRHGSPGDEENFDAKALSQTRRKNALNRRQRFSGMCGSRHFSPLLAAYVLLLPVTSIDAQYRLNTVHSTLVYGSYGGERKEMYNEESNTPSTPANRDAQPRVVLTPLAAPSILGLYGLAAATFLIAAQMARWFPTSSGEAFLIVPIAALLGGLAQFLAGMWAYKARDGVATAVHGIWGAFFIGFGLLPLMTMGGPSAAIGAASAPLGYVMIVMAAITWGCTFAAGAENKCMVTVLTFLAAGATVCAIGLLAGSSGLMYVAAYLFIISSLAAWYTATALMVNEASGREVWALGRSEQARQMPPITVGSGEPGVIRGQA
jgi:uncharacterized protein